MGVNFKKIILYISKYKYVILILALGLVLMLLPTGNTKAPEQQKEEEPEESISVSDQLCSILRYIEGAGDVKVMLTTSCGEETVYYETEDISNSGDSSSVQKDIVTVTDSDRNQTGLVRYVNAEKYLGAIVVCEGADSAKVRESIIDAVSKVTGLRSDKISVLKML